MNYSLTTINLLSAFLILILGLVLGNILANIVKKIVKSLELSDILEKQLKLKLNLENTLSFLVKYTLITLSFVTALTQLGVSTKIFYWTLLLIFLATLVFIILAFKDWIPNLLAGLYLSKTQKIKRGDTITVRGVQGKVLHIDFLETQIRTDEEETLFIPNSILTKEIVTEKK